MVSTFQFLGSVAKTCKHKQKHEASSKVGPGARSITSFESFFRRISKSMAPKPKPEVLVQPTEQHNGAQFVRIGQRVAAVIVKYQDVMYLLNDSMVA